MSESVNIFNSSVQQSGKTFKKGSILQYQGDTNPYAYYVKSGLLRSYTVDQKGKEHIFLFAPEGWIMADIESQEFQQPAELFIDCIEDSEVVVLNRKDFLSQNLSTEDLHQQIHLLSRRIAVLQKRMIMMMSATARERYLNFIETYPGLTQRVPQRMIASYLGVTPEALSKIRGDISKEK